MLTTIKSSLYASLALLSSSLYAAIIPVSSTDVLPGTATYIASAAGDMGGYPTPYTLGSTITPQNTFFTTDDIRVATQLDLDALDRTTDNGDPAQGWSDIDLEWYTVFYYLDTDAVTGDLFWNPITQWLAYAEWDDVEEWQANPAFDIVDFFTADMRAFLPGGEWAAGQWQAVSYAEDLNNPTSAFFAVLDPAQVPEPAGLAVLALGLVLLRRKLAA